MFSDCKDETKTLSNEGNIIDDVLSFCSSIGGATRDFVCHNLNKVAYSFA